jgi:release factor glutamine methyltransferase
MTIEEARRKIIDGIEDIYEKNEAIGIAELLVEHITKLPRIERIVKKDENLSKEHETFLNQAVERLKNNEPVQYIINEAWFGGMKLYVDGSVLIPRPETEELVEWILKEFKMLRASPFGQNVKCKILDVGTGSGCIAIALKKNLPNAEVWACDVSDEALNIARMNADALQTAIDFVPIDFLDKEQRKQLPRVDIVVSNPPYVPEKDKNEMRKNILDFEPSTALFVADNNLLVFYNAIADFGKEKLHNNGSIYVEVHEKMGEQVQDLFKRKDYSSIEIRKDLQEKNRMIKAVIIG